MIARRLIRGDVVLATIPFTDLQSSKIRPAVVISDGFIGRDVILAGITSIVRTLGDQFDVVLDDRHVDFQQTGLKQTSVVRAHHLVTVEDRIVARYLGCLTDRWMAEIDQKLGAAIGLDAPS